MIPRVREQGFDVLVLTVVAKGRYFDDLLREGVPARCARMRGRMDLVGFGRAVRYGLVAPDLVVTHSINAHVIGHVIARLARVPHVSTEHGGANVPTRFHRRALTRIIAPRVDLAITVSRAQVRKLIALGYRPERIRVIPNAVPDLEVTKPAEEVRHSLGIESDRFLAVLAATLRPEKAADMFLTAVRDAHRSDPRVKGVIIGGGPQLEELRQLAGTDTSVRVLGERNDVANILNAADVVCLSSRSEGAPMVILEAMALGKPVIAANVGGIPEVVQHEVNGLLVPPGNRQAFVEALLRVAADSVLAARLGAGARERHRQHFALGRMIAEYSDAFEEVLERGSPRRR